MPSLWPTARRREAPGWRVKTINDLKAERDQRHGILCLVVDALNSGNAYEISTIPAAVLNLRMERDAAREEVAALRKHSKEDAASVSDAWAAVIAEREACAKVAESFDFDQSEEETGRAIAASIRSRSTTGEK